MVIQLSSIKDLFWDWACDPDGQKLIGRHSGNREENKKGFLSICVRQTAGWLTLFSLDYTVSSWCLPVAV